MLNVNKLPMSKDEKEKNSIFDEALQNSLSSQEIGEELSKVQEGIGVPITDAEETIKQLSQEALALSATISGDPWDDLSKYINGAGAQRMIAELHAMNSKDFARNYMKILEHFKPKLVRSDSSPEDDMDRTINIELTQKLPSGEVRTINLNQNETKRSK